MGISLHLIAQNYKNRLVCFQDGDILPEIADHVRRRRGQEVEDILKHQMVAEPTAHKLQKMARRRHIHANR